MKKIKNIVFFITTILLLLSFFIPNHIKVEAVQQSPMVSNYGGPILDFDYIYNITKELSYIIYKHPNSREFGEPGEQIASEFFVQYMQEIGLHNVHREKITGDWTEKDSWQNTRNLLLDPDYRTDPWIENLELKKNFSKWYIHIKIYDKENNLVDERNFSKGSCFPFLKEEKKNEPHNVTIKNISIFDDFQKSNPDGMVLIETNWRETYDWWVYNATNLLNKNVKGFILMDSQDDTFFMLGSGTSSPSLARFSKPGFSINGSSGKWIKRYLNDSNYIVKADFCSEWTWEYVDSWNVIGEVPGRSSKTAIICAHYDSWRNQGTCDQLLSVTMALGIAKYLIDNDITPELTLKIIAFAGEEWYYHGSKSYIKNHEIKKYGGQNEDILTNEQEDIIYVFNPSNIGFNKTFDMSFNVGRTQDDSLMKFMQNVARELKYEERTGISVTGEHSVWANDVAVFCHTYKYPERYCKHGIEFDRYPFPGYHRDGKNHTKGDVFSEINDTLFRVDSEVITEIILRLTVPKIEINFERPLESSFYLRNFKIMDLPKRTFVYGPMKLAVDIESDNEIEKVEFYVDNKLKRTDDTEPFTFNWSPIRSFSRTIKVAVYDKNGCYADEEIEIFKWRVHPLFWIALGSIIVN